MPLYLFIWNMLSWTITVAVLWPVMFPWTKVAYRIWHGRTPIEEELEEELWTRSFYASTALTGAAIVILLLDYVTVDWLDLPAGPVHCVYYVALLTLAAGMMYYCFFMEDFFQGLSLTVIYLYIPVAVLFVVWLIIHRFFPYGLFSYVLSWLKNPEIP